MEPLDPATVIAEMAAMIARQAEELAMERAARKALEARLRSASEPA